MNKKTVVTETGFVLELNKQACIDLLMSDAVGDNRKNLELLMAQVVHRNAISVLRRTITVIACDPDTTTLQVTIDSIAGTMIMDVSNIPVGWLGYEEEIIKCFEKILDCE